MSKLISIIYAELNNGTIVPQQRVALGDIKLVERYWALSDEAKSRLQALMLAGFEPGHPVYRQRLGELNTEIRSIRERLQNIA